MNKITLGFFREKSKSTIKRLMVLFVLLLMNLQVSLGQATLPFSYDSGKPTTVTGLTHTALGSDYSGSPKMKFDTTSDNLILNFSSAPGNLSFKIQWNQSAATNRFPGDFTLQESADGITYSTVQLYNSTTGNALENATAITETFSTLSATTRYIKWIYTTKSNGNIAIGAISLSSRFAASPTLNADASSNTVDNNIDITFTDDSTWRAAVTAVKIGTTTLTSGTDYDLTTGNLKLKPSGLNVLLTAAGSKAVTVVATGYTDATVTQGITAGVPTTNSTATINASLAPNTSRTISCTAKDQYSNVVSGYTFKYDVTITNNDVSTSESYTIDGTAKTATAIDISLATTTNASGVATFTAALPATIDGDDGVSIQVQLNNGTTNIASAFAFNQLASQTITFGALTPVTYGGSTFDLTGTASSGLTVSYASSNTAVATVSGSTVTIVGAGSTNITASQAGNGSYNAAANVIQALTINAIALTLSNAAATSRAYNTLLTTTITGTLTGVINSDNVTFEGTLKGTFADANVANGIAVTAACTLAGTKAGNYTLTQPTGLTASISQASQTIIFGALDNKTVGDANFSLTGSTSSTLAVSYASSNEAVATVSGSTVTIIGAGSTNITASQAGNGNYTAATDVVQSLIVVPTPIAAWDFTGVGSSTIATLAATTLKSGLVSTSITRGISGGWSTGANSWRTQGFQNNGISTANTDYFQITIQASTGKAVSLSTIDANFAGTNSFAASPGVSSHFAYSLDGTTFTLIGSPAVTIASPASLPQIDLTPVTALQNVVSGTTITLRYYASGQTSTGGWGFNSPSSGTNGLSIGGNITILSSTTWNGTAWSNGAPTASLDAIIAGNYSAAANITAKTLTVNNSAIATIPSGNNVTVTGAVTVTAPATLTFSNNANLIQVNDVTNTGTITVNRNSNSLKRLDYTLWSSPVASQNLAAFSPLTSLVPNRFYIYNPATDKFTNTVPAALYPLTTNFSPGAGYLIRMPNEDPATLGTSSDYYKGTVSITYNGVFTGKPNNGNVSVNGLTANTYNAVGNPYPSTLDAALFLSENSTDGVLYFWRKTNGTVNATSSYATYTTFGSVAGSDVAPNNIAPDGKIAVGQGFIVKTGASATTLNFTNAMRTGNNSAQFFKTKQVAQKDRVWLNLTNASGAFSQTLIGYVEGATTGVDNGIDGKYINDSPIALTSNINNEEFTIQGRPAFDASDVVALNFKTDVAGDFTIAIDHSEGVFASGQDIYLVDSKTGTETNLKNSSYTFAATAAVDNTRFSLKFQKTLGTDAAVWDDNSVLVYKNNGTIYVNSGAKMMNKIKVFDIQGRLIAEQKNVKTNAATISNLKVTNQALIVQITSEDNKTVNKKILN